jgi:hypothetical protein
MEVVVTGVVDFAAQRPANGIPFVLVGSTANVLDRWQPPDSPVESVGAYHMEGRARVRGAAFRTAAINELVLFTGVLAEVSPMAAPS